MGPARPAILKIIAAALILSGNCFVCPLAVHAAPKPAAPHAQACSDDRPVEAATAVTGESGVWIAAPVPVCPLEQQMTGPQTAGEVRDGSVLERPAVSVPPAAGQARLPEYQRSADIAAPASPHDRSSVLTGTIVKNE